MKRSVLLLVMLFFITWPVFAQLQTIRGQVRDESGKPVAFATISEKGTKTAVQSDAQGNFTLSVHDKSFLEVTAVGYQSSTVQPSGPDVTIILIRNASQMQEVVVTALGQTRSKAKVGYSTTSFSSEALSRNAPVSLLDNLAGKVAGAEISNQGGPGASTKVVLRGYGVIAGGNNQPLYVIDGVPLSDARLGSDNSVDFGNGAGDINPNDIETITILKGTAAASLYGSNARNGVIMITTKRGKSGKLKVEYDGSVNFSEVGKLPEPQSIFGQGWSGTFILSENGSWGPKMDGKDRLWGSVVDHSQLIKPFSFIPNNLRDFYTTGTEYNNTLALSGGNETNAFYFSYGNVTSDGVIPTNTDYLQRNSFSLRTNSKFQKFSVSSSFNYVNRKMNAAPTGDGGPSGSTVFSNIVQIPVDIPISDFRDYKNKFFNVDSYFTPYAENPYYPLYENGNTQHSDRFFGNVDMNYTFSSSFSAQLRAGGDFTNARTFGYNAVNAPAPGSWNAGANVEGQSRAADVGSVMERNDYVGTINGDFILNYTTHLSSRLSLEALAGINGNQQDLKSVSASITNLVIPGFYSLSNSSIKPTATDYQSRKRLIGVYGQAIVGWNEQVYLTVNARNDWSSTLPVTNNHFFYPGANLSWIASQSFHMSPSISLLKFRAGYGKTGYDAPVYDIYPILTPGTTGLSFGTISFPFNGVSGFGIANTLGNSNLQPVITSEAEAGAELRLFKNRIGLDLAFYDKRTQGQIFTVPISPSSGYTGLVENLGLVQNKGVEVSFDARPVYSNTFNWSFTYTFSKNYNKVLNLTGGPKKVILNRAYDAEMDAFPGKTVFGLYAPVPVYTPDGRLVVNPKTGVPLVAPDKGYYGDAENDYMMGLQNSLSYKNWSFNFSLDYRKGGVMYSGTSDLYIFTGNAYVTTYNDRRPFIIPNSVVQTGVDANNKPVYSENKQPILETGYDAYWYPTSNLAMSYFNRIIDRSFLKLRDASLSYRLPARWSARIHSSAIGLSVYVRNILLWTPASNLYLDPEASNLGNDLTSQLGEFRTAPTNKQFGIALKANF